MKQILLILAISLLIVSCKTIQYVPVNTVKTEYRDRERIVSDTIIKHDSIHVRDTGDTVFVDRFSNVYKYRDRFIKDSIFIRDSIQVPYPVEKIKEVSRLTKWQAFQIVSFRIMSIALILLIALKYFGARLKTTFKSILKP